MSTLNNKEYSEKSSPTSSILPVKKGFSRKHFSVEYIKNNIWKTTETIIYNSSYLNRTIYIPKGFMTDFATIPRIFWSFLSPFDEYARSAILHDFLYAKGNVCRKSADKTFLEAMTIERVPKWKRTLLYYSVRIFGKYYFNKKYKKPIIF